MAATWDSSSDIVVLKADFDLNPRGYIRQASSARRVVVRHSKSGRISAVFGGSLDTTPEPIGGAGSGKAG
jgi:hypothetical protein